MDEEAIYLRRLVADPAAFSLRSVGVDEEAIYLRRLVADPAAFSLRSVGVDEEADSMTVRLWDSGLSVSALSEWMRKRSISSLRGHTCALSVSALSEWMRKLMPTKKAPRHASFQSPLCRSG